MLRPKGSQSVAESMPTKTLAQSIILLSFLYLFLLFSWLQGLLSASVVVFILHIFFAALSFASLKNSLTSDHSLPFMMSVLSVNSEMMTQQLDKFELHVHKQFADIYHQYAPFAKYDTVATFLMWKPLQVWWPVAPSAYFLGHFLMQLVSFQRTTSII